MKAPWTLIKELQRTLDENKDKAEQVRETVRRNGFQIKVERRPAELRQPAPQS